MKIKIQDGEYYSNVDVINVIERLLKHDSSYTTTDFERDINDRYGTIIISGKRYYPGKILMDDSPARYQELFQQYKNTWINNRLDEMNKLLYECEDGEHIDFYGIDIKIIEALNMTIEG